jgi:capsular exopolysaccharide synthesis family protein
MTTKNSDDRESLRPGQLPRDAVEPTEVVAPINFAREIQTYWFLFLDKWWLIGAIVLVVTLLVAIYVLSAPKLYTATATVQVELHDQSEISDKESDAQTGLETLNTIVGKFKGRRLLVAVLAQGGLLSSNSATLVANNITASSAHGAAVPADELKLVKTCEKRVTVALRRNSRLIDISVIYQDPGVAAKLANLFVQEYLRQDFAIKSTTSKTVSEFFKAEYDRLHQKVQASEQALQDYEDQVGTAELANPQNDEILGYENQLPLAKADMFRFKSAFDKSLAMGTNVDELLAYTAIASDPQVIAYQTAIAQKETDLIALKQQYREKNPKYIVAVSNLADLKGQLARKVLSMRDQIQESCRLPYENAAHTVEGLEAELAKSEANSKAKSLDLSLKRIRFNILAQEAAAASNIFATISTRFNEMTASSQMAPAGISIIAPATPPAEFSSPHVVILPVLGFVGSLVFACALIIFLDLFNTSLRTVDAAESYLCLPVLAAFPELKLDRRDHQSQLVVLGKNSRPADRELFRALRACLSLLSKEENRSFLFTSSFANEGKTFAACNFAASLAQQGFRTLVLDWDLRRPRVETFFTGQCKKIPGVADVLENRVKLTEVAQVQPGVPNLSWVAAGSTPSDQVELLSPKLFRKLLEQALSEYDRVVIDTPPIQPVKDALLIANEVNAVITLVDGSKTPRKAVAKTMQWLRSANAPVAGVVLNRVQRRRSGSGYRYNEFLGYGYGHYGHKEKSLAGKA